MRIFLIAILCTVSVCLAQESYHNDEFGFTIEVPAGWNISFEDQWSDEVKVFLEKLYSNKTLLVLNPPGVEIAKPPCVHVQGMQLKRKTTSEMIAYLKRYGKERLTKHTGYMAEDMLGRKINQYSRMDTFYNYDSSRKAAIAKILYKHNERGTYVLVTMAKFVGRRRVVDFSGYWKGDDPESFLPIFNEVVDSFEFDHDTAPKGSISEPITLRRVMKWGSIILTVSIILGFARMFLRR